MDAIWTVYGKRADFKAIGDKFHIDQVIARIIRNREVIGDANIDTYLNGTLEDTHDPMLMKDMEKGCRIIAGKILEKKSIRIISDYDVDGVMSNYILLDGLYNAGADVSYEIPDRMLDGYGINERIINDAHNDGIDTIITCDNGIAAFSAIELAKSYGMTVVVTDHHEVFYELDENGDKKYKMVDADAIIDIKQEDCRYPFKGLCGAGVAYKFIRCLYDMMGLKWDDPMRYIDMLAIATQCDVMSLTDENRIYVKYGLEHMINTDNVGLRALLMACGLEGKKIYSYHLGFVIGPCINATGRLESAKRGLELLLTKDDIKARHIAEELKELNIKRKEMTNNGVKEAICQVNDNYLNDTVLVIYMPDLHESLAGIVAGRVREHFYKPTIVMTNSENGLRKGSGRSIEGYHMFDALVECGEYIEKFGGHELAAGLSVLPDKLDDLRMALNKKQHLTQEQLTPTVRLDVPMPISYITTTLVNQLSLLEPFGKDNEKPLFGQSGLGIKKASLVGKEGQYVRITFQDDNGYCIDGMDFNADKFTESIKMWFTDEECDKMFKGLSNNIKIDVAYYPEVNTYNGRTTVQIKPVAYRKHQD